ncbi:hypothetical protein HYW75_06625 [Candidatus Pacearchaeota archaeon]|nr:hypothetical protein [Candidatus Pacearchaeota archaeon]
MKLLKKTLISTIASAIVLSLSSCMHYPAAKNSRPPEELSKEIEFDLWKNYYRKQERFDFSQKEMFNNKKYRIIEVTINPLSQYSGYNSKTNVFDFYISKKNSKNPTILLLPIMGGKDYPIESHFARYFTKKGYNIAIVHREQKIDEEVNALEDLDALLKWTVSDNKRVLDWLESQNEVDANKIGLFSISFGAIKGSLLLPLEPRIKAAVLGLGGGNLPYILAHTTEKGLIKHREKLLKKHNLTLQEGEEILRSVITYEPYEFAKFIDPDKIMLVNAKFDKVVPYRTGIELKKRMGNPESLILPTGHYTSLFCIPYIKSQAYRFFERKFSQIEGENKLEKLVEAK